MRASFVRGLDEDATFAVYNAAAVASAVGTNTTFGLGLDSITAFTGTFGLFSLPSGAAVQTGTKAGFYCGRPGLGYHFLHALERGSTANTHYGDAGAPTFIQNGLLCLLQA